MRTHTFGPHSEGLVHAHDLAHALLRDAVYAQIPAPRRVRWHAELAAAIETGAGVLAMYMFLAHVMSRARFRPFPVRPDAVF